MVGLGSRSFEECDGFRVVLLVRSGERRPSLLILLINLGAVIKQQLQHFVAGVEMHRHVQAVLSVFALDCVGILPLLKQPFRAPDAATGNRAAERSVPAVMLGAAGAVEFASVRQQHLQGVKLPVTGGVIDGVVVGTSPPSLEEHFEDLRVIAVDGLIDAACHVGAVVN